MDADALGFGTRHFGTAELGDRRLTQRLIQIADRILEHPDGTLPQKMTSPAELEAVYRFVNNDKVSHAQILQPHRQEMWRQLAAKPRTISVLFDTTELDYSGLTSNLDLGPIGNGSRQGYLCHNGLAIDAETWESLGLISQVLSLRHEVPKNETRAERKRRTNRESLLWLKGVDQAELAGPVPAGCRMLDVFDRGGDTFEFFEHEFRLGRKFLTRSAQNRRCWLGHGEPEKHGENGENGGESVLLHDALRALATDSKAPKTYREIRIGSKAGRPARTAQTTISWMAVQLRSPAVPCGAHGKDPLRVWALRVWEENPPEGCEGVEWLLLTNAPVENEADAVAMVKAYESRWVIEELHKGMKTGMKIESLQLTRGHALQTMIAILSVVAVALLRMRDLGRKEETRHQPAAAHVPESWIAMVSLWRYGQRRELTVAEFLLGLARMGGHQNRKGDGMPGWQTLWKGMLHLQAMLEGAACFHPERCDQS
jgi:Transposase DNA-binding